MTRDETTKREVPIQCLKILLTVPRLKKSIVKTGQIEIFKNCQPRC